MNSSLAGSFRLFRVFGITVFIHWSWFLVALFEIQFRPEKYNSPVWNAIEYLSLFGIVLLHEFGHALACRSVGGRAEQIVLWPLGGVAFVNPPPRPGALLWSIAAGPLVNVLLLPVTVALFVVSSQLGWRGVQPDLHHFLLSLMFINGILLVFNLLPIYPLDGGQILMALLWFVIDRATSLLVVSVIGMVGGIGFVLLALALGDWWLGIIAAFVLLRSWAGLQQARLMARLLRAPRHPDAACPSCGAAPLAGRFWVCDNCRARFDTFAERGVCPNCFERFTETMCPECRERHPIAEWFAAAPAPVDGDDGRYYA
jgi:Zn-dependent protease